MVRLMFQNSSSLVGQSPKVDCREMSVGKASDYLRLLKEVGNVYYNDQLFVFSESHLMMSTDKATVPEVHIIMEEIFDE